MGESQTRFGLENIIQKSIWYYWINMMDAFILFVLPPLLGFGIYWLMKHDFVQFMIGYIKKRIGEKKNDNIR